MYIYYPTFSIIALLVSFILLFSDLSCQKPHVVRTILCPLVINIFLTCFGFTLYRFSSQLGLKLHIFFVVVVH